MDDFQFERKLFLKSEGQSLSLFVSSEGAFEELREHGGAIFDLCSEIRAVHGDITRSIP